MKLTKPKVAQIKAALAEREKQPVLARKFKISRSVISDIATGRVHKDVPWPEGYNPVPRKPGGQRAKKGYDPTNERIMELEAEIVHLHDELKRERRRVKAGAKTAGLFKAIVREMDDRVKPIDPLPTAFEYRRKAQIVEHCVMHVSDGHHDQVITPDRSSSIA